MRIGVDYYPEQWDKSIWEKDAGLMARTGVKVVRLGEHMWQKIEPEDGKFDFSLLFDVINTFARFEIKIVLCVPTGTPPLWLFGKHPEIIRTGADGVKVPKFSHGSRCVNSKAFRAYAKRMAEYLVKQVSSVTSVIALHIDSSPEVHSCVCEVCKEKFRSWLADRYNNLDNINMIFGRSFSVSEYGDISQIEPPDGRTPEFQNPALSLEWYRFGNFCTVDFLNDIRLIVKQYCPRLPVTTNAAVDGNFPDFYQLFSPLDFVSCNNYPPVRLPDDPDSYYSHAFWLDMMRGIKGGFFWVSEQLSGIVRGAKSPQKGMIMGYSMQAMIHGAETVMHFRWRTSLNGAEMARQGILDQSNRPNRRFSEFAELCRKAEQMSVLDRTYIVSDIAILYSPESEKALGMQPQSENFSYIYQLKAFHSAFTHLGANIDVISPDYDLSRYRLIIAPSLFIHNKRASENIYRYVINGGTLVLTNRSGVKDGNNNFFPDLPPSVFKELIGAEVTESDPVGEEICTIRDFAGNEFACSQWCDIMHLTTAKAYAEYNSGENWSMPAITLNKYCKGVAYYVGTVCHADFYESFALNLMMQTGIPKLKGLPRGVEVTTRTDGNEEYICFFNNSESVATVSLPKPLYSVINSLCMDRIELKPFEADIVRK